MNKLEKLHKEKAEQYKILKGLMPHPFNIHFEALAKVEEQIAAQHGQK